MAETMQAGRELDALVAEKLFGYRWYRSRKTGRRCIYPEGKAPEWMDTLADGTEPLVGDWNDGWSWTPAYSTSIAAALTVLDALGGIVRITRLRPDEWHVQIGEGSTRWGETLPLAICRAVLAAVESPHAG